MAPSATHSSFVISGVFYNDCYGWFAVGGAGRIGGRRAVFTDQLRSVARQHASDNWGGSAAARATTVSLQCRGGFGKIVATVPLVNSMPQYKRRWPSATYNPLAASLVAEKNIGHAASFASGWHYEIVERMVHAVQEGLGCKVVRKTIWNKWRKDEDRIAVSVSKATFLHK